jgi:hypothetical protein
MGDIVSLKQVRKQVARDAKEKAASENRAAFGRTKVEKHLIRAEDKRATSALDAHKRDDKKP